MCRTLGANEYIFGGEGKNYADADAFRVSGVTPHFLTYKYPTYSQLHGDFVPNMSFIDLLFNEGPGSIEVVRNGSKCFLD